MHFPSLAPRLRLFLSVDLIGSTALKQRLPLSTSLFSSVKSPTQDVQASLINWLEPILQFYQAWPRKFSVSWQALGVKESKLAEPYLWTTVGDELIYIVELENCKHAYYCVSAWIDTASKMLGVPVKLAAWVAGFPVINREVISHNEETSAWDSYCLNLKQLDLLYAKTFDEFSKEIRNVNFFGPSIDTGFRLAKYADQRKMPISIELAYILSKINKASDLEGLSIHYDGRSDIKGVMTGKGYPVFWIDRDKTELGVVEDKLCGREKADPSYVVDFIRQFVGELKQDMVCVLPYIVTCECCKNDQPSSHAKHLKDLVAKIKGAAYEEEAFRFSELEKDADDFNGAAPCIDTDISNIINIKGVE